MKPAESVILGITFENWAIFKQLNVSSKIVICVFGFSSQTFFLCKLNGRRLNYNNTYRFIFRS